MSRPQKWREDFIADMRVAGVHENTSRAILRVAATLQHLAEAQCNGDFPADHGDAWETRPCSRCESHWHPSALRKGVCVDCRTTDKAKALVATLEGWRAEFQGDPRGCVVKLYTPEGREIGVP